MGTGEINLQSVLSAGEANAREVVEILNDAKLYATYDSDVLPSIWRKACVNGTMNSNCAVLDCTIGELFASQDGQDIVKTTIQEFVTLAHLEGVDVDEQEITDYVFATSVKAAHHYPSMHQDLIQNKRLTEIEYLNGYVARKSKEYGVESPYCEYVTKLIHTKESLLVGS